MTRYSLRRRLIAWLLAATALIGVLALLDTRAEAIRTAQGVSDRVLAGSALAIAERVTADEAGGLEVDIPYSALEMLTSTAQDQVFYRVDGADGVFLTGYESLRPVPVAADGIGFADGVYGAVPIRLVSLVRDVSTGDGSARFTVTVAESTLARDALARSILRRAALRLAGMIFGAAAISWVTVTLALRPLDRLGEAIAERSPGDLRPVLAAVPAEVEGLVEAINSFMGRLDTALGALRNFTGNASHQLRTPLTVIRTQLALATRAPDAGVAREAAEKADAAVARAERVLAQLLVLARVDAAAGGAFDVLDVAALARGVVAEMVPAALRAGVDLGYEGDGLAMIRAEPVLLAELLRNLLDNAVAYAGPRAVVTLRTVVDMDVVVEVEDNGPGLSADRRAALAQGKRGAGSDVRRQGHGGYGFGLAIVQEIASLMEATVTFESGPDQRGLRVRIAFDPV